MIRSWPLLIAAVLLLGAATAAMVAIRFLNVPGVETRVADDPGEMMDLWRRYARTALPADFDGFTLERIGARYVMVGPEEPGDRFALITVYQAGWPFKCLQGAQLTTVDAPAFSEVNEPIDLWQPSQTDLFFRVFGVRRVPLRPLWPGLIVNTIFYAATWLGIVAAVRRIRNRARLDRSACPRCGYALTATPPHEGFVRCPECGASVACKDLQRPKQVVRLWMIPLLLPVAALLAARFFGLVDWRWLRFHMVYIEPYASPVTIASCALAVLLLLPLTLWAYADRPPAQRWLIAMMVAISLGVTAYAATYTLCVRWV